MVWFSDLIFCFSVNFSSICNMDIIMVSWQNIDRFPVHPLKSPPVCESKKQLFPLFLVLFFWTSLAYFFLLLSQYKQSPKHPRPVIICVLLSSLSIIFLQRPTNILRIKNQWYACQNFSLLQSCWSSFVLWNDRLSAVSILSLSIVLHSAAAVGPIFIFMQCVISRTLKKPLFNIPAAILATILTVVMPLNKFLGAKLPMILLKILFWF